MCDDLTPEAEALLERNEARHGDMPEEDPVDYTGGFDNHDPQDAYLPDVHGQPEYAYVPDVDRLVEMGYMQDFGAGYPEWT